MAESEIDLLVLSELAERKILCAGSTFDEGPAPPGSWAPKSHSCRGDRFETLATGQFPESSRPNPWFRAPEANGSGPLNPGDLPLADHEANDRLARGDRLLALPLIDHFYSAADVANPGRQPLRAIGLIDCRRSERSVSGQRFERRCAGDGLPDLPKLIGGANDALGAEPFSKTDCLGSRRSLLRAGETEKAPEEDCWEKKAGPLERASPRRLQPGLRVQSSFR
jgi:hypothetical protein